MSLIHTAPRDTASRRWHRDGQTKDCLQCGQLYQRKANEASTEWDRRRYCSLSCSTRAMHQRKNSSQPRPPTPAPAPTLPAPRDHDWRRIARCRNTTIDFMPDKRRDAGPALALCAACPVRPECLAYGLATKSIGVWGGEWLDPTKKTA